MSTALYRRYRPETFADVIGQEHVTEPLSQALRTGRVSHAYLFSGPRGCGKTTSARILARCLNCEQGPTDTPCGVCASCVGLARGGPGTVDVIEIDAASHGGVDDARDLREKASFGPAVSRYKIYIIDEAHMVTSAGFNALLKVVEEPPPHVKFVFATTEPEKVIGTIRSRTHHYPFRLVPPVRLQDYLGELCGREGVQVAKGVLPLVVRAGGGSVRDSLSVLDQLIAGSSDDGITYERAVSLLGYTDSALLDAVVDAFAARDGATVFRVVDRVIESGHEPRRFVEDLLERLRDLVVISAVPDGAGAILRGIPEDQLDRMRDQAARYGAAELSRAADVVNTGLTELTGATAPRLQLELLCARVLLPAADGAEGYGARLDRIERRLSVTPPAPSAGPAASPDRGAPASPAMPTHHTPPVEPEPEAEPAPEPAREAQAEPAARPEPAPPSAGPATPPPAADATPGALDVEAIRHAWPDVATRLFSMKKVTFMMVKDAQVLAFDGRRVTLGIASEGAAANFRAGAHGEFVRQALIDVLALDAQVEAVHGDTLPPSRPGGPGGPAPRAAAPPPPARTTPPADDGWPTAARPGQAPSDGPRPQEPAPPRDEPRDEPREELRERSRQATAPPPATPAPQAAPSRPRVAPQDDHPSADDADADDSDLVGRPVVERLLGGVVIDESEG
ncbi:MAG TPA: DNA polymerase III subunit gamma and tau [Angustibacter sp.]|nr:DNA polymerase III subunit gamma and tau [Angustibacter sp.]